MLTHLTKLKKLKEKEQWNEKYSNSMEDVMEILLEQLSRDVRNSDLEAFNIEEQEIK